jgi:DNA-binding response OmpR family regulator
MGTVKGIALEPCSQTTTFSFLVVLQWNPNLKEQTVACTSPPSFTDTIGTQSNALRANELVEFRFEEFPTSTSMAKDIGTVHPDLALSEILSQSDGMQMLITFTRGTNLDAERSEPVSLSVRALVMSFTLDELAARMSSPLTKSKTSLRNTARFDDIYVDFSSMEVSRSSGEKITITAQEFKALRFFVSNPGRVVSRDELLDQAWGYHNYPTTRTVDNHVLKLRQKLEVDPSRPRHFLTVHGVGYKFLP